MFYAKFLLFTVVATLATAEYHIKPRIVQGHDAVRGQFPFYVFFENVKPKGTSVCGGSLIHGEWVLTAAHCVHNATSMRAHLGSLRAMDGSEPGRKMFEIYPKDMHINPDYSHVHIPLE